MYKHILLLLFFALPLSILPGQNLGWLQILGGTHPDDPYGIKTDIAGNVLTTGTFGDVVDFDSGPGTTTLNAQNGSTFILKTTGAGKFSWVIQIPTPAS